MSNLQDKVALVTGSGRGIGKAIAIAYAKAGAHLALSARTEDQLNETAKSIQALAQKIIVIPADVTNQAQVKEMANKVREEFGRLDILVNNAGGGIERSLILESDPDLWVKDVTVNCTSAYLVTHAFLPLMIESGGGKIINIGSGMGHRPGPNSSAYHVGKAGMWMFTQCLSEEVWEYGIDVNELIPGPVATDLTQGRMAVGGPPPFAPSEYVKTPEEVTPLALWLATQPKGGPTGQSFSLTRRPI
ncbi:MAG: SDR family oxidoreductase [Candidatus Latescibacteria bacterium]|jgi:3-oxoacyl-[acyl-carrier protein] reductase|nr:SDR family oxidoreductase [Candidatus Latescibacterota bacterium]MBT4138706.1 SDR family oxidoreductase [Candidatus Latescibacterota bacterium]MBT5828608.1 SDR family oxidoreductase [Candidatus Latescibacterota bacterium]